MGLTELKSNTRRAQRERHAFTVIELIVSIAIIALLLGIAVFGVHTLHKAARGTVDLTMVNQIGTGVDKFEEAVGFLPPLVKDRLATGLPRPLSQLTYPRTGTRNAILVYEPDIQTDIDALNLLPTNLGTINTNPFEDEYRYSESSLTFFLVGALDARFDENNAANVVIDGVKGPGLYKPNHDGEFLVPRELVQSNGAKAVGTVLEPFVNIGSGGAKVAYPDQNEPRSVRLVDSKGVAIRYYRWVNGNWFPAQGAPNAKFEVRSLADLKVPRLVGRFSPDTAQPITDQTTFPTAQDRDIRQNPQLRSATWAIVAAGPNGVFGDEPLAALAQALGKQNDVSLEAKLRSEAEKDNIVRVGDGK